jgi:predicted transcriptional regulator
MLQRIDLSAVAKGLLAKGQTTASIAREIGVTQPTVSRLATGKSASLGWNAAVRLIRMAGGDVVAPLDASDEENDAA